MAYYLSKRNEEILLQFLPLLKSTRETIKLESNDTEFLVYILRNAAHTDKYKWLRSKFLFSLDSIIKEDRITSVVVCKIRQISVDVVDGLSTISDRVELIDIVNKLIQDHPPAIRFSSPFLTESEYEKLEAYCATQNYNVKKDNKGITVIKQ